MDFGRDCLIFVRGKEKTDQISFLGVLGANISIKYRNKDLIYSYDTNSATVLYLLKTIELSDGTIIYENNIPLSDVKEVYQFDGFFSIYFKDGRRTYPEAAIQVAPNGYWKGKHLDTMDYFREISYKTGNRPYQKLDFLHPESVMYKYLNGQRSAIGVADENPIVLPFDYNLCEIEAIKSALSNDISIIESPPGAWKTETILNLILNLAVLRKQTVAVVSCNKATIDNIYERMMKEGYGFIIARPGRDELNVSDAIITDDFLPEGGIDYEEIASLKKKLEMYQAIELKEKELQEQLSLYQLEQKHFEKIKSNKEPKKFYTFPGIKWDYKKTLQLWSDLWLHLAGRKKITIWTSIRYFLKYCIYDFDQALSNTDESIYTLQKSYLAGKINELEKELKKVRSELEARQYQNLPETQKELSCRYVKKILYDRYHDQLFDFNKENFKEKESFEEFIRRFPVVLSTSDAIRDSVREDYIFDYLIIDDSSQSDLLTGLQALSCCRKAVIAGDSKQLFHTGNIKVSNKIENPEYNYFEQSLLSSFIDVYKDSLPNTFLYGQYRYHPDITRFCNEKYYQGTLISYAEPKNPEDPYSQSEIDLIKGEILNMCTEALGFTDPEENIYDVSRYVEYLTLSEKIYGGKAIPVFDLLYQDYNSVLLPKETRVLKKLKSENTIYTVLDNILKQNKYRHLLFNYNMRLSDIIKSDGKHSLENEECIKNSTVDFTIYSRFGKKPGLVIEVNQFAFRMNNQEQEERDRRKEALLKKSGINVLRLMTNSSDEEDQIVQSIEDTFFSI